MHSRGYSSKVYDIIDIVLSHYCKTNMMPLLFKDDIQFTWFLDILRLTFQNNPPESEIIVKMKHYLKEVLSSDDTSSDDTNMDTLLLFSNRVSQLLYNVLYNTF